MENSSQTPMSGRRIIVIDPVRCLQRLIVLAVYCLSLGSSAVALAQTQAKSCVPVSTADWMVSRNELAAPIRPADCSWVTQTPPDFGWPDLSSDAKYQVTLFYPDGRSKALSSSINWLNWNEVLPAGYYGWQVQVTNAAGTQVSQIRHFTIDSGAKTFLMPDAATLYSRVTAKPHPRGLPDAATLSTMLSQRQTGLKVVVSEADGKVGRKPQAEPTSTSAGANWSDAHDECKRMLNMALAYVFTKQTKYLTDATARLRNMASWNPSGTTSYTVPGMDMGAREIAWSMALVYDWLWPQLDASTRTLVLKSLQTRTQMMVTDVIGTRSRVAIYPRDSHRSMTLTILAAMSTILAGDLPAAQTWLRDVMPQAANAVSPWGDDDSGHGNGTTQGSWDMGDSLVPWYVLRWGAGIDIAQKAWMRNWSNFIAYTIPPGTPSGNFGDGAETAPKENWSRFGKAATWFAPTPLGRWYASQLTGEDPSRIEVMLAPPADYTGAAAFPTGTPNTMVFRGIGWAAMHSDLANPARTSVYFKSSPYGSYNHSHGDQNSFVINAGGKRLAIDSGYYDDYKTAHWLKWYKHTKAHNAITFDGGIGQTIFELTDKIGSGKITSYVHGSDYELVQGDATLAYPGTLTKARRALLYLPPNLVLVYDDLASATARQWEWNIHSLSQMTSTSGTDARIVNGDQSLCVKLLAGPTTGFRQTNAFAANPTGTWSAQWHGTFYSTTKLPTTEFITLLNVGCVADTKNPAPAASRTGSTWTVNVANKVLTIDGGNVSVGAPAAAAAPKSKPYTGTPIVLPATFEAENFDLGGEGLAYHDAVKGNAGGQYRTAEDVDIVATCDPEGGGFVVNNFNAGEWLAYTISVPATGRYDIAAKVSSNYPTGAFHIEIDGADVSGSIAPVNTGSWCTFKWFGKTGVPLTAGTHVLKVFADQQYFNFNQVRVTVSP